MKKVGMYKKEILLLFSSLVIIFFLMLILQGFPAADICKKSLCQRQRDFLVRNYSTLGASPEAVPSEETE